MAWHTCFKCDRVVGENLIPRLIVSDNEIDLTYPLSKGLISVNLMGKNDSIKPSWHFASIKEINGDVDKLVEKWFCRGCEEEE